MIDHFGLQPIKNALNDLFLLKINVPELHMAVIKVPPVAPVLEPEKAIFSFNALSATSTAFLFAVIASRFCLGLRPGRIAAIYWQTLVRVRVSLLTIALMLALEFVCKFSATDTPMGLAMASTGLLFPLFSPLIGWLGVALTGSNTSSNVLFGNVFPWVIVVPPP